MKKAIALFVIGTTLSTSLSALPRYASPVNGDIVLAGNFGEPRPNHFHGGIDIKTGGVEGKPVFSIGDGYVSHVSVGAYGYGNAVYVYHPEGYTSVYCHLKKFTPQITAMMRKQQYLHRVAEGEFHFRPTDIPVAQGQLIAVSGNTGASMAPHLHLEIRETRTGNLLDPLAFLGHLIIDTTPPQGHALMAYPKEGEGSFADSYLPRNIALTSHELSEHFWAWGKVGFGIWANDYMEGTYNHYGVRKTELFVDGKLLFSSEMSIVSPRKHMLVNAWGDYDHYLHSHVWYMKSFIEPGVTLPILNADENRGYVDFNQARDYHLCFVLTDFKGNQSRYEFTVEGRPRHLARKPIFSSSRMLCYDRLNNVQMPGLQFIVSPWMVRKDLLYQPLVTHQPDSYSDAYRLSYRSLPLFSYQPIAIRLNRKDVKDPSKLYIVSHWGFDRYMGGTYRDGWVWGKARELNTVYELDYDDQPPVIEFLGIDNSRGNPVIRLSLNDDKSGLLRYEGYVDGKFVLFEPLGKSSTIECKLRHSSVKPLGKSRKFSFLAEDNRHNKQTIETEIIY